MNSNLTPEIFLKQISWETADCVFCSPGTRTELLFQAHDELNGLPGEFSLVRCTGCALVFQSPRPTAATIQYYYPDSTHYFSPQAEAEGSSFKRKISDLIFANYFGYIHLGPRNAFYKVALFPLYFWLFRDQSIPHYKKDGQILLEIGCSHGYRLKKDARRGWSVCGIEPNAEAARFAQEQSGLDVRVGSIMDHDFPENHFDAIRMDMVLEHLHAPLAVLERASRWLKPGGEMLITIPYFEGVEFGIFGRFSYGLQLPTHIYFFNKTHLQKIFTKFTKIEFVSQRIERDFTASAAIMYKRMGGTFWNLVANSKVIRSFVVRPLSVLFSLTGQSSRLTVRATK